MLTQVVLHTKVFIFSESSGRPAWTAFFNALAIKCSEISCSEETGLLSLILRSPSFEALHSGGTWKHYAEVCSTLSSSLEF